jgi:hypothetical protein
VPAHQHYQVRLLEFLRRRGVEAEGERDFVDVRFLLQSQQCIGEIKVTSYLSIDEAFRTALGQLLFYAHLRCENLPAMVMFLDRRPHPDRINLASRLGIAVVAEDASRFVLLNPDSFPDLSRLFSGDASSNAQ